MANGDPHYYHGFQRQVQHFSANVQAPSVAETPIGKLADAINNLADALRTRDASES